MPNAKGRPSKKSPDKYELARQYVKDAYEDTRLLPTVEGLAIALNVHRDSLYAWAETDKDFSDILEDLKKKQANKLIQLGLQNKYNSTIAKMILSGKHGYIEKQNLDHTTNGKDMPTPILGGATRKEGDE